MKALSKEAEALHLGVDPAKGSKEGGDFGQGNSGGRKSRPDGSPEER